MDTRRLSRLVRTTVVPLAIAGLVLGACSKNSPSSAPSTTSSPSSGGANSTSTTTPAPQSNTPFCKDTAAYVAGEVNISQATAASQVSDADWSTVESLPKIAAEAPADIKSQIQTLSDAVTPFIKALQQSGGDSTKIPQSVQDAASTPAVNEAGTAFDSYMQTNCGIVDTPNVSSSTSSTDASSGAPAASSDSSAPAATPTSGP